MFNIKSFYTFLVVAVSVVTFISCKKEKPLNPKGLEESYIMTPGTTAADKFRYDFFQKYGTKILFEFHPKEYYYTPTNALDSNDKIRYITNPATHERALRYVNYHWLQFYPSDFKQEYLPLYILLTDRLVDHINRVTSTADSIKYAKSNGFASILIAGLGSRFDTMSTGTKARLRAEVHLQFLYNYLYLGQRLKIPDEFFEASAPFYFTSRTTPLAADYSDYGPAGFVKPAPGSGNPSGFPTRGEDLNMYLKFIIESDQATVDAYINPTAHANVKKKYNILVNYFNSLGVNLRSIHSTDPELAGSLTNF
ncbi:MAG TPA: hypothetical protein VIK74_04520 [Parasegetibacter sp.]|jgi:hypothetical protein